ncbi:hypothetical protein V8G54_020742 [Vigna mungo]|uniref:Uncharacterized protein n=1 Tax=Vigna mungo TaxID=3915 RepID=A0AAQ3RX18_VIGMU
MPDAVAPRWPIVDKRHLKTKVRVIKERRQTPIKPSLTNPRRTGYENVHITNDELDAYLYWKQNIFNATDEWRPNHASTSPFSFKHETNELQPKGACLLQPNRNFF